MKHRNFSTALLLTLCCGLLMGCACVSRVVDEGESMMNDLESSLLGHENSQGILMNDSNPHDSRLENSKLNNTESLPGMVNDNGDTSGATGTTNTAAFRSLSRPSSAPGAKASSLRSSSLDHQ